MAAVLGWLRRFYLLFAERRALPLLRGRWYRFYYPLRGVRLQVGSRFHVYGSLRIQAGAKVTIGDRVFFKGGVRIEGEGEVVIGDCVTVLESSRLRTHNRTARIAIGDRTWMRGPSLSCAREIVIGQDCMIAPARIQDTDFHSTRADRRSPDAPVRVSPVHVADNVWIADRAALLAGTKIGQNSVVGFGAVCMRGFPENVIILGNPARVAAPIPSAHEEDPTRLGAEVASDHPLSPHESAHREILL